MGGGGEAGSGDSGEPAPPAAAAAAAAGGASLHIRCANGSKFTVQADLAATVGAFKEVVAGSCDVPAAQQRLIYKGRILKDEQTLESYGVETDHTIHMVRGAGPPAGSAAPAAASPQASTAPSSAPTGGLGSLFPGLGGTGTAGTRPAGLFGSGFPELDQMQQQLSQNPNLMREIMNMPMMQNLMNNPDLIRNMIMNNPQMRDIIDRNPDLAHVLNDPSVLRQTLEAARNPEIMREMMRNTDRAMSNIESSPEGFNMLRRMYETVQEPFLNATTMGGEGNTAANPFSALLGNQGSNQPRDPASNAPNTVSESTTGTPAPNTNPLPNPWSPNTGGAQGATRAGPTGNARTGATGGLGGLGSADLSSLFGGLAGNTGTGATGGLGGLGSADLGSLLGGSPDSSSLSQILQNPAMMQMMQNIMSDPQSMNQLLNFNPNTRNLMESNTQLREMFQNPEFIRQLTSPETLQQLLSFQQTLLSQLGQNQPRQDGSQGGNATGMRGNVSVDTLMSMLSGLGAGGGIVPPEELYATQLTQLQEMGFIDTAENIQALVATAGNVNAAVERLLGNLGQ
ncbi:ubiquitin domain-containing protein DSK2a-like isoform X2 [Oryza brachyantha]|uniref:ubiquitin domain-containing protein DSK2a-like isoform X2 n=1 Tax=Oryza brachyantha TaxID=4533 RepID=UPI001ADC86E2|nr:ubiquitin domain-containing protein DSK2a-like isoform X2 [Oryza brachyantha]